MFSLSLIALGDDRFGSTIGFREERAVVVAQWVCARTRRVIHISTAVAVIFLALQVAGAVVGG
jgi:hypothetical protein